MARIRRGGRTDRVKWQHTPHGYEGNGPVCEKCQMRSGNSIHGDMDKIAEKIAAREEREADERRDARHPIPVDA